jgi:putative nucleotidyltransferase with HDIG domain
MSTQLTDKLWGAVAALERALQAKDPFTLDHSSRVRRFALAMATELRLSRVVTRELVLGAELHDIGKIGVPDELLQKPGPLSPDERHRVLDHAEIGARILTPLLGGHPLVLAVVRWHHERVDGGGYPDGLRGIQVPLVARIVAVADAFDAMTSPRPYRAPSSARTAAEELIRCAGRQFDAHCVEALLAVLGSRGVSLPRRSCLQRIGAAPRRFSRHSPTGGAAGPARAGLTPGGDAAPGA